MEAFHFITLKKHCNEKTAGSHFFIVKCQYLELTVITVIRAMPGRLVRKPGSANGRAVGFPIVLFFCPTLMIIRFNICEVFSEGM